MSKEDSENMAKGSGPSRPKNVVFRCEIPPELLDQVRMAAEMHSCDPALMLSVMVRAAIPAVMSGLVCEPIWRGFLFLEEDWYEQLVSDDATNFAEVVTLVSRIVAEYARAATSAHNAYKAKLLAAGRIYKLEGLAGLRVAAADAPEIHDQPGRYPIK